MIETLLALLGLPEANAQINAIIHIVTDRMLAKLRVMTGEEYPEVPCELRGIVIEVCVQRFNRIGSEGASQHELEGERLEWE